MSSQSRIAELAAIVSEQTARIDNFLAEQRLPYPSFEADGPTELNLSPELEHARVMVLQATQELNDLLQGPRDLLFNHEHNLLVYLKLIAHFDLARRVPVDTDISFKELAATVGVEHTALTRILRLGIAHRIFKEPRPGYITHSAASRQIRDDLRVASWFGACVDEMWPAAAKVVDALVKWPQATEPNQTGFALANDTDKSFYAVLAESPERARRFGTAMSFFTTGEGYSLDHLTDGYPWGAISPGTVVDVGGSHGDAAFSLARHYPQLEFIVQELPEVVASCQQNKDLNVVFMKHDFFEEQPIKGAEIYLFRWILHNWPDKYCINILRALIPALKRGARVLIMEMVMPPPGLLPNGIERKLRAMDLTMMEIGNAKERDLSEWKNMIAQADPRFIFRGMKQPPGSRLAILEATWEI